MFRNVAILLAILLLSISSTCRQDESKKTLEQREKTLSQNTDEEQRFYMLDESAKEAFEAGEFEKAEGYAEELLNKAPKFGGNWNYGNAIHQGNIVLGRLALQRGELEKAKQYLIEAGKTPGSPQLNSFGPNMSLAQELLEKGEREIVIQYFKLCSNFWKMDNGRLSEWTLQAQKGEIPDFGANLIY